MPQDDHDFLTSVYVGTTPTGEPDYTQYAADIVDAALTRALIAVNPIRSLQPGTVRVSFVDTLTGGDVTALDAVNVAHTGTPAASMLAPVLQPPTAVLVAEVPGFANTEGTQLQASGLLVADIIKRDGSVPFTSDIDLGTNAITNVGDVDGVNVSTHAARHENAGADEINVAGLSGVLADAQTAAAHAAAHQDGGGDEINVGDLSGLLADAQTPLAHASAHEDGGGDEISIAGLSGEAADPQPPKTHAFAGADHSSDTYANLLTKISNAYPHPGETGVLGVGSGLLSIGSGAAIFNVAAGSGQIISWADPSAAAPTQVSWGAFTDETVTGLATDFLTAIFINSGGSIVQRVDSTLADIDFRNMIFLGLVWHTDNTTITLFSNTPSLGYNAGEDFRDLSGLVIGEVSVAGNVFFANVGANLEIDRTAGKVYGTGINYHANPNQPSVAATASDTTVVFDIAFADGEIDFGVDASAVTDIDPNSYNADGLGTVSSVASNRFTIQRIYAVPSGTVVLLGEVLFLTLEAGLSAVRDPVNVPDFLEKFGIHRSTLVVRGATTDLTDTARAEFVEASGGVSGGGSGSGEVNTLALISSATGIDITSTKDGTTLQVKGVKDGTNIAWVVDGDDIRGDVDLSGVGDVTGPGSAVADQLASYNGTSGKIIKDSGLATADVILRDGSIPFTGDVDLGTNAITNVGLVDGVDVSAHAARHQNGGADEISVAGLSGVLADAQTAAAHAAAHQNAGGDEINVAGLSGVLADDQNPTAHATEHQDGGVDEISVAGLSGDLADDQKADRIRTTTGPTLLTVGAVPDGEFLKRVGATLVGAVPGGATVIDNFAAFHTLTVALSTTPQFVDYDTVVNAPDSANLIYSSGTLTAQRALLVRVWGEISFTFSNGTNPRVKIYHTKNGSEIAGSWSAAEANYQFMAANYASSSQVVTLATNDTLRTYWQVATTGNANLTGGANKMYCEVLEVL